MRVDEAAVLSDGADAVGVAVGGKAGVTLLLDHRFLQRGDVRQNGLGIDAGEERIVLLANGHVLDAVLVEDAREHAATGAVHRVDGEFEIGAADEVEVGELADRLDVGGLEVDFLNFGGGGLGHRAGAQFVLDDLHDGGRGRSAELAFELHAIPVPGVVAGSDHDAAGRAEFLYVVRNGWSGHVVVGQQHGDAGVGEHLGNGAGSAVGGEARVVADDDAAAGVFILENVGGDGARDATHVVEGEIVGDEAAPAVGAEFDFRHGSLVVRDRVVVLFSSVVGRLSLVVRDFLPSHV